MSNPFTNRITGYGTKAADQFMPNELNYRTHPQKQRDAVQASLRELGWIGVVVENKTTGRLIDGHERVWQALKQNEQVPYIEVELSEDEEKLALAVFDPITYMAETDSALLDALLREVNTGESALQELLASMAEDAGLYQDKTLVDAEPQIDRAEELRVKWQVEANQLWQLGEHRLICGDCTDGAVVARVMGGEKANILLTDPPYSSGGFQEAGKTSGSIGTRSDDVIAMDNLSTRGYGRLLADVFRFSGATDVLYLFTDWRMWIETFDAAERGGWRVRNMLVWDKEQMGMGLPWRNQHELILFGKRTSAKMLDGKQGNVLKNPRSGNINHPTEKPAELLVNILTNTEGAIVYDPFSGSGTAIIACEQLGRKCRAVEISPGYVAVALQRYADACGVLPVLVE